MVTDAPILESLESRGHDLILVVRGQYSGKAVCAQFDDLLHSARDKGFHDLVVSFAGDSAGRVEICQTLEDTAILRTVSFTADTAPTSDNQSLVDARKHAISMAHDQSIDISAIWFSGAEINVAFENGHYRTEAEAYGRLLRVLTGSMPPEIEVFHLMSLQDGLITQQFTLPRETLERTLDANGNAAEIAPETRLSTPTIEHASIGTDVSYPRL